MSVPGPVKPKPFFVEVDSDDRISGTHSNFNIHVDMPIHNEFTECVVLSAAIPKSMYDIQEGQNFFDVKEGATITRITIPENNYSIETFQTELETQLDTCLWDYEVEYKEDRNKWFFTVTGNGGVQPEFMFGLYLHREMGFELNSIYTFLADSLESEGMVNFVAHPRIRLLCDFVRNTDNKHSHLLESMNCLVADYEYLDYLCPAPEYFARPISLSPSGVFHFIVTDDDNNELNLNLQSVNFLLRFS